MGSLWFLRAFAGGISSVYVKPAFRRLMSVVVSHLRTGSTIRIDSAVEAIAVPKIFPVHLPMQFKCAEKLLSALWQFPDRSSTRRLLPQPLVGATLFSAGKLTDVCHRTRRYLVCSACAMTSERRGMISRGIDRWAVAGFFAANPAGQLFLASEGA